MSLADSLLAFIKARNDLHTANGGADRTIGCVHEGAVYVVLLGKQGVCGITQANIADAPSADEPETIAPTPEPEAPKKTRGRPKLDKPEAPIAGPGSAPKAEAPAVITKDALRAFARQVAEKTSVDAVKAVLGGSIESLDPAVYAEKYKAIEQLQVSEL